MLLVLRGTLVGRTLAPIHVCVSLNSLESTATPALTDITALTANVRHTFTLNISHVPVKKFVSVKDFFQ